MATVNDGLAEIKPANVVKTRSWSTKSVLITTLKFLAMAVIFGLAYTQAIQFNDNQNTKFLHGIVSTGRGYLQEDWLANTTDPLPVFSFLVKVTYALNPNLFYVYYVLLFGVYIFSLMGIASILYKIDKSMARYLAVFAILVALHALKFGQFVDREVHFDLTLLQYGVAGQYILGSDLQNSTFGVFILLSMYTFLKRRYVWSVLWLSLACIFHSAYLFGGALLTIAYLGIIFFENLDRKDLSPRSIIRAAAKPFWLGLLTLALVFPVVLYNQIYMTNQSAETAKQALYILVHMRIPHHTLPEVWLTRYAYFQVALILVGMFLARKSRLFILMLVPFLGGLLASIVQIATSSDSLGMLGPWRVSVFLVPLATTLVVAYVVTLLSDLLDRLSLKTRPVIVVLAAVALAVLVYDGVNAQSDRLNRYVKDPVHKVMTYIQETRAPGQLYLVPPLSNKFDEFRIYTGAPLFINWKSHPYRDMEVLEWYKRNQLAQAFYGASGSQACSLLKDMASSYHITHMIIETPQANLNCDFLTQAYRDKRYTLFEIAQP